MELSRSSQRQIIVSRFLVCVIVNETHDNHKMEIMASLWKSFSQPEWKEKAKPGGCQVGHYCQFQNRPLFIAEGRFRYPTYGYPTYEGYMENRNGRSRTGLYDCEDRLRRVVKKLATSKRPTRERLEEVSNDLLGIEAEAIPDRVRMQFERVIAGLDSRTAAKDLIPQIVDLWADVVQSVKTGSTRWHRNPINLTVTPVKKKPSSAGSFASARTDIPAGQGA
jgi:hypothetical protein